MSKSFKGCKHARDFKLYSYELKKEINSDRELKEAYFQAVSNSSWANYGYLVAFEFNDNLKDEMARLNQSFGIGIIELSSKPHESKVLYPARLNELDFKTIDKLCYANDRDFGNFIEHIEKLMSVESKYSAGVKSEFENFCDKELKGEEEIKKYCNDKHIPYEEIEE